MTRNTAINSASILALVLGAPGCLKDESLDTNRSPVAIAQAVGSDGKVVDAASDGGVAALQFEYGGSDVKVTLVGSNSKDLDGKVVGYDWRYVVPPPVETMTGEDGGAAAPPSPAVVNIDPDNVERPTVELPMGEHTFTLWVTDNEGAVSTPDTITVNIGSDPIGACVESAFDGLDEMCSQCLCGQEGASGDSCRTAVPTCGKDCWGLIGCIAAMCPTFTMDMDITCVVANCLPFVAGGMTGATAAGTCITPCVSQCTPSITAIVTGGG